MSIVQGRLRMCRLLAGPRQAARRVRATLPMGVRVIACIYLGAAPALAADACPEPLASATRLALVTTPAMAAVSAEMERFERVSPAAPWRRIGERWPVAVGLTGVGWGWSFAQYARPGEPLKKEGDKRTPAGFFRLGRPFGFDPAALRNYLRLEKDQAFCVDDLRSPAYNTIVPRAAAGPGTSGETMWTVSLYRRGIAVDFPTNRAAAGGSCIFVHIWRSWENGTVGCVALAEPNVAELQAWASAAETVLGVIPAAARARFADCLPPA
ncbi:MAG: L,D-transpeptidase family protein [Bauldia sp.]